MVLLSEVGDNVAKIIAVANQKGGVGKRLRPSTLVHA